MPKDIFRFKQFSIWQTGSTLKVCTDSCLFGAWAAHSTTEGKQVLDIGTGTGLLALIYAQQHPSSSILALEIDPQSADLAQHNFDQPPWVNQLKARNMSLQNFCAENETASFDVILCNPPFFENQLLSANDTKNLAKHSSQLSKAELVEGISKLLSKNGATYILLPPFEAEEFVRLAYNSGLFLNANATVKNSSTSPPFRQMMLFEKNQKAMAEYEIVIYESEKVYTAEFVELLRDYYLYL